MPRQILPSDSLFKHWVPGDNIPEDERKDFVFPELWVGDISNDEWNSKDLDERRKDKRQLHQWLDQFLYNGLLLLMTERFEKGVKTERDIVDFATRLAGTFDIEAQTSWGPFHKNAFYGMIYRIAASKPYGIYVSK